MKAQTRHTYVYRNVYNKLMGWYEKNNNDAYARFEPTPTCASARDTNCAARQTGINAARLFIPETRVQTDKNASVDFFLSIRRSFSARSGNRAAAFPLPEGKKVPALDALLPRKKEARAARSSSCSRIQWIFSDNDTLSFETYVDVV